MPVEELVERLGGAEVGAEGLLDDDPDAARATDGGQPFDCRCEDARREGEIGQRSTGVGPERGGEHRGIGDVAGDIGEPLHQTLAHGNGEAWGVSAEPLPCMAAEGSLVPRLPGHAHDDQVVREKSGGRELGQGDQQIATGEIAGGAQDHQAVRRHPRSRSARARFMPLDTTPTWLNAWGWLPRNPPVDGSISSGSRPSVPARPHSDS